MPDTRLEDLTESTTPASTDLVYAVIDPGVSSVDRKVTLKNVLGHLATTAGDLLYATAARTMARLGIGSYGQYLGVNSGATAPAWTTQDGWIPTGNTWTYATATTFTVAGDVTAVLTVGTKINLTQTTVKYFYVTASSYLDPTTTVTITGGSDYTLANAAITLPMYSYASNPQGFPGKFAYTPTLVGFSADPTNATYRFMIEGRTVFLFVSQGTSGTSNANTFTITLPVTAANISNRSWSRPAAIAIDNGVLLTTPGLANVASGGATTVVCYKDCSAAVWTTSGGKRISNFIIEYEI